MSARAGEILGDEPHTDGRGAQCARCEFPPGRAAKRKARATSGSLEVRSPCVPTFLSDYAEELKRLGDDHFVQNHPHSVLVVTGVVGALADQVPLNRTLATEPAGLSV